MPKQKHAIISSINANENLVVFALFVDKDRTIEQYDAAIDAAKAALTQDGGSARGACSVLDFIKPGDAGAVLTASIVQAGDSVVIESENEG